jgi:hypothetical protein
LVALTRGITEERAAVARYIATVVAVGESDATAVAVGESDTTAVGSRTRYIQRAWVRL